MSGERYQLGDDGPIIVLRRPWPAEAIELFALLRHEQSQLEARRVALDAAAQSADLDAIDDASRELYRQHDGMCGWLVGSLLLDPAPPNANGDPTGTWGRRVWAHLAGLGWSPEEAEAAFRACVEMLTRSRLRLAPSVEAHRLASFGSGSGAGPGSERTSCAPGSPSERSVTPSPGGTTPQGAPGSD